MAEACNANLPTAHSDVCEPGAVVGQINTFYFTNESAENALSDPTSAAEWNARLDNDTVWTESDESGQGEAPIRFLHVIGELPESATTDIELPLGGVFVSEPRTEMTFDVFDVGETNYNLYKDYMATGGQRVMAWVRTEGGKLLGGNSGMGISGTLKMKHIIPRSKTELERFACTFIFDGIIPYRIDSPI